MSDSSDEYGENEYRKESVLRELYIEENMTMEEVGEVFGVGHGTIAKWCDRNEIEKTALDRFKHYYKVDDETGCWEWQNARDKDGYGVYSEHNEKVIAHRFAYKKFVGEIPDGAFVLHNCDNPPCVNPEHLRVGTHEDNMQDAKERTDTFSTEKQREKKRKLSKEQVLEIRDKYRGGDVSMIDLAEEYDVDDVTIYELIRGETWGDVGEPITGDLSHRIGREGQTNHRTQLTEKDVREIRKSYDSGEKSAIQLADEYGVTTGCIYPVVNRKTWKHVD